MATLEQALELRYEGVHCNLVICQPREGVVLLTISGTDIGEFGETPMRALHSRLTECGPVDLFIDARDVRGASIGVSGEWALWLNSNKRLVRSITMLTGRPFIRITAEFVRRFAGLEGLMRICTEPGVFDESLASAPRS